MNHVALCCDFYAEILNIKILSNFNRIDAMIAKKHDLNCPECFKLELYH